MRVARVESETLFERNVLGRQSSVVGAQLEVGGAELADFSTQLGVLDLESSQALFERQAAGGRHDAGEIDPNVGLMSQTTERLPVEITLSRVDSALAV